MRTAAKTLRASTSLFKGVFMTRSVAVALSAPQYEKAKRIAQAQDIPEAIRRLLADASLPAEQR
jgi:hypothetical protein